jgi:transcriptional repressor NrdR
MECSHCGGINSRVIDSRLAQDRISIRRRRQCLTCSMRFTTYESTEEQMLAVLIKKKAGHRVTKTNLKIMLSFISNTLSDLSDETKKLMTKVDKIGRA